MKISSRRTAIRIGALLLLFAAGVLVFSAPGIKWRIGIINLKFQGKLSDLSWAEVCKWLRPGSPVYLGSVFRTKNPYESINDSYTSKTDITSGAQIFRSQCAPCHGVDGSGGTGANLKEGKFRYGSSDWALFRIITRGIPGTAMPGWDISEKSTWRVVAFMRSLVKSSDRTDLRQASDQVNAIADRSFPAQATYERLLRAGQEPGNWLTYSGIYNSHRYSQLNQIDRKNVGKMKLKWLFQMPTIEKVVETTPLVVNEEMFLTEPPNNVWALDTKTGEPLWSYERKLPEQMPLCCGRINRGLAILENRIYMGTLDAHLVALDARTGDIIWDVEVADYHSGYSITAAPLAVKDKIIVGIAGGEYGIRGFLDAYDAKTGVRVWRFYTIPGPGEPGHETWEDGSWETGGAPTWLTGSFDPESNLIYWGVGNPGPVYQGDDRGGDNLYSNSVIALDADTGKLKWHFQFTPHDEHDWDSVQIPVLVDVKFRGRLRKLMLWANRNAFYYILDRDTGEFLLAHEFAKQTWAKGIDSKGRPIVYPNSSPSLHGTLVYPSVTGATNWWSPSYSPLTNLLYVPVLEKANIFFKSPPEDHKRGELFTGSAAQPSPSDAHWNAVRAITTETGDLKWEYRFPSSKEEVMGGILSTAGDLVFCGYGMLFFALDADSGQELWRIHTGGRIIAAPITYLSGGKQQVTIAAGRAIFTFGLEERNGI